MSQPQASRSSCIERLAIHFTRGYLRLQAGYALTPANEAADGLQHGGTHMKRQDRKLDNQSECCLYL